VDNGEIAVGSYLLVESLDRLSRQKISSALRLFLDIADKGINLVTISDGQVYRADESDFSKLIISITIMARAYEESQTKSKRLSAAWENKRNNIDKKILTKICPLWLKPKDDRSGFDCISDRVEIVKRIFYAASNGQGSGYITRALNKENIPPFGRSKGWQESYVTKTLKNRSVLGEYQPNHKVNKKRTPVGEVIRSYYPQIIEEDVFLKVQADRGIRRVSGAGRKGEKQNNLFTHIVKCMYCGASMRFLNKGKGPKGGTYLKCSNAVRGVQCVTKAWRYKDFETSFFSFVREFNLKAVLERTSVRTEQATIRTQINIENERLNIIKSEQEKAYQLSINAELSSEFFLIKLEGLSFDIKNIEQKITNLNNELNSLSSSSLSNFEYEDDVINILTEFNNQENIEKRFLVAAKLKEFIKEIRVATDGKKPNFERTKSKVEEGYDNPEEASKIIEILKESHFNSTLSNPHFSISFYDGTDRLVIPSPDDATVLLQKAEVKEGKAFIEGGPDDHIYKLLTPSKRFPIVRGPKKAPALKFEDGEFKPVETDGN
jgi:hypothetical protein